jgi:hypothetical protein
LIEVYKGEIKMPKTQVEEVDGNVKPHTISLAFRVVPGTGAEVGLFAPQVLMLHDDRVAERRTGLFTTLGHAIGAADDLMDGWAFNEVEQKAEDYFRNVYL